MFSCAHQARMIYKNTNFDVNMNFILYHFPLWAKILSYSCIDFETFYRYVFHAYIGIKELELKI